ncbi:hypothetical protein [Paenibacillus sp. BJ-4]|uniref:hypothetical protein n=1 Tax=Paenibacillus sp. BJ-4 TaxID=2878097 RepID=UPI001CF07FDE|nr:hypothetical protein [Paenibacillus sp. BJ-4]
MIILNFYGNIEPTIISKKLGVGISNPPSDWVIVLQDEMLEEMIVLEHNLKVWRKEDFKDIQLSNYDLTQLVKKAKWNIPLEDYSSDLEVIARNLVVIDVLDFKNSYLQLKNDTMDSPTCEVSFPRKFINFCNKIQYSSKGKDVLNNRIPFSTFSSDEFNEKPRILNFFRAMLNSQLDFENYNNECLSSLVKVGALIDDFLQKEEEFWIFDYIINSMYHDREYNAYHVFKVMSLIEMLIINPSGNGRTVGELERKLPLFLKEPRIVAAKKATFAQIMRQLRNKIAHGDYRAIQLLLKRYREEFMINYQYDEFEYSIENWTYLNICCRLDEVLNEIVWELITNKERLRLLQYE